MKLSTLLAFGGAFWFIVAVSVIPRIVRSGVWVTVIVLAGGGVLLWVLNRFDDDPFVLAIRIGAVAVSTILAMLYSEMLFRREHGWWRILDGESGRNRQSGGEDTLRKN